MDRDTAIPLCQALGAGFDLMTNAQWQTIARNIENVASNWSGGTPGNGEINHGHADGNRNNTCDASLENVQTNCLTSGGLGIAWFGVAGAIYRGGSYANLTADSGIFTVGLLGGSGSAAVNLGFRCVYNP